MKFKFEGVPVVLEDGQIICDDKHVATFLQPLMKCASGSPHEGDPHLNVIVRVFGADSITDIENDDYNPYMLY